MASEPNSSVPRWLDNLLLKPKLLGVLAGAVGALSLVASLLVLFSSALKSYGITHDEYRPEIISLLALSVICILTATVQFSIPTLTQSSAWSRDSQRMFIMVIGGLCGLIVCLLSLFRAYAWRELFTGNTSDLGQTGLMKIAGLALLNLLGLGLLFVSLLLARAEERTNSFLRRLFYGYNTLVTTIILLEVLVFVNVLVTLYVPAVSDWTQDRLYTLHDKSIKVLKQLDQPVKVYVVSQEEQAGFGPLVKNLLENCQRQNSRFSFESVNAATGFSNYNRLAKEYSLSGNDGLLVVSEGETEADNRSQFLNASDLFTSDMSNPHGGGGRRTFIGEAVLLATVAHLLDSKTTPVIYFTQGSGELQLEDSAGNLPESEKADVLKERLKKAKYDVKGLLLSDAGGASTTSLVVSSRVPDDAAAVVIAGYKQAFSKRALEALQEYMKRPSGIAKGPRTKGRLVLALDVVPDEAGKMKESGLEPLLAELGVKVGNELLLQYRNDRTDPRQVLVTANSQARQPDFIKGMDDTRWLFTRTRTVESLSERGAPQASMQAEPLLLATPVNHPISELTPTDFSPPDELVKDIRRQLVFRPVAVSVTEMGEPRAIVLGAKSFLANSGMRARSSRGEMVERFEGSTLLSASLAWFRGRPAPLEIEEKIRSKYKLHPEAATGRMIFEPCALTWLLTLGLGVGIWLTRRR